MRPRRSLLRLSSFAVALLVALSCNGGARGGDARAVVTHLYETLDKLDVDGAPTPAQLDAIRPYISTELHDLLRDARAMHDADEKRAPDEKPSFAEGDLFSSLFEGPSSFEIAHDTAGPNGIHVVRIQFKLDGAPTPLEWSDRVVVNPENGKPVVTDVLYDGHWPFANHGTLLLSLREALRSKDSTATNTSS